MHGRKATAVLLRLAGALVLALLALASAIGPRSSEAQQGAMQNCPQADKWAISVWSGDDGTGAEQAFATCDAGAIVAAYYLVPEDQTWQRWFAGRPLVSTLETLNDMQGVIALGAVGAPAPTPTPTPTPTAPPETDTEVELPGLTPFDAALEARAHGIRDKMAQIRGLERHLSIQEGTISRDALGQYYQEQAGNTREEEGEELRVWNTAYGLLHLIGPEDDLLDIYTSFSSSILGFYSPNDDKLVLVAEETATIDTQDELTLAHEYVHSFQDARFDIEKLDELAENEEETRSNTEYGATVECLLEGDAVISEFKYAEAVFGPDWYEQLQPSNGEVGPADIPPGMARYFYFPYVQCALFVAQLFAEGGWDAVNTAYEDVPTSTEQILHPEKYASHEHPMQLEMPDMSGALGEGWEQLDDLVFGEFDAYNYLLTSLEGQSGWDSVASEAAAGWGGGRLATYAHDDPTRVVLHLSLQWDTAVDLNEFAAAFLQVAGTAAGLWWPADPGISAVRWDGASEHGFATWQGISFLAILSSSEGDLRTAVAATGNSLDAAVSPTASGPAPQTDEQWLQEVADRHSTIGSTELAWHSLDMWEYEGVQWIELSLTPESAVLWLFATDQAKNNWGYAVLDEAKKRFPGAAIAVVVMDPGYYTWSPSFGGDWCHVGSYYPGSGWYQQCTLLRAYWFESLQDSWVEFL